MSEPTRSFGSGTLGGSEPSASTTRPERRPVPSNGSADIGLLLLRLVVGGLFFAHGAQKIFSMWGGQGITRTAENLAAYGFVAQQTSLAWALGIVELAAGAFLVLGLFTPLAAAGLLAIKIVALLVKIPAVEFFAAQAPDAIEVDILLAGGAAALLFAGAGRIALDNGRTWLRRPMPYAVVCLLVTAAIVVVVMLTLRR